MNPLTFEEFEKQYSNNYGGTGSPDNGTYKRYIQPHYRDLYSKYIGAFGKQQESKPTGNFLGSEFGYLSKYLKDILEGGLPNKANLLQEGKGLIDTSVNNAVTQANEGLASRGLYRSGVGAAVEGNIRGQGSQAYAQLGNNLNELEQKRKSDAIARLLGLNQFEGGQNLSEYGMNLEQSRFYQTLAEQMRQFNIQQENQPSDFARILGGLLSAGATVGSAAL